MIATIPRLFAAPIRKMVFHVGIEVPTRPGDMARRHWNRIVREAMQACLHTHHKKRIPLHFRQDARAKYGYKPRSEKYKRYKDRKYKSRRDLVKTGKSERRMKREGQIIVGGAAEGGKKPIVGRLRLKFDFSQTEAFARSQKKRFSRKRIEHQEPRRGGVTIADMKREIQAFTPAERREFAAQFLQEIFKRYNAWKGSRKRARMPTK